MPHTGGVAAAGLEPLHHFRRPGGELVHVAVEYVDVDPIVQAAVVLIFSEVVADFHDATVSGQKPFRASSGIGAVQYWYTS